VRDLEVLDESRRVLDEHRCGQAYEGRRTA
jgi:hypothetical protein